MRKKKIYLDTSVISYLRQEDAPEKMAETLEFWEILKTGVSDMNSNQSFNVDDIRRVRDEAAIRYGKMTYEEMVEDIRKGSEEAHRIMERIRRDKDNGRSAMPL